MNGFGDGSGGRRNEEDSESDIMNKLEDSLDLFQQTTGFVSSYTLPLSHATYPDDGDDGDNNASSTSDLLQPIKLAKMLSLESNASSVGTDDDDDGLQEISSIFRAPSPSVSPISSKGSPPRRGTRNSTTPISSPGNVNINTDDTTDDEMMLLSTPEQHSIASESTDAAQNISLPTSLDDNNIPMKEGGAEITIDSSKNNSGVISPLGNGWSGSLSPHPTEIDVHQQEGSHKQEVETDMANNETVAKPKANNKSINSSKWKSKQKRRPTPTKQPKIKKNNLVIQHTPARLPPTHPLSQSPKHSIKSRTATKKSPNHNRRMSEASEASSTCGSEAGLISMASEATPIISPAHPNTFSFSDDETSESNAVDSDIKQPIPLAISASGSTAELRGVDISFTLDCDDDYDEDEDDIEDVDIDGPQDVQMGDLLQESLPPPNMVRHVSAESTVNDTAAAAGTPTPLAQNLYKGDAFFDSTPTPADVGEEKDTEHRRQFSKDENFFDAVYNSGLQSTSFEQVADTDSNTSMVVEVEMVCNADGERSISENLVAASFTSDDGSCATEEEKRVMTKRIMQWRKGRELWRNSEGGNSIDESSKIVDNGEDVQDEDEHQQENEEYYDGVELAPLSSSSKKVKRVMNNIHNAGTYDENEQHVGELTSSQMGNSSSLGWRLRNPGLAIRNYIWRWNLQPSYSYDYAAPTQRASNGQQPVSSPQATFATANDDSDGEDENESKALTPYKTPEHRRKQSMHYDDVDFDRNDNCCSSICCCCWKCFDLDNYRYSDGSGDEASVASALYSDWKKLLMIAVSFFFLALLFTHGQLEKHHNMSYDYLYGGVENDPLARDNFINRIHAIEDGYDDDYWKNMLESPVDDDEDFHAELFMRHRQDPSQYVELEEDVPDENEDTAITPQHNSYSGIDTIVVLGLHELHPTFLEWMIDRLQKLYPDMRVMGEFPIIDEAGSSSTNPKERMMRLRTNRKTKVIDPTSNKVLGGSDAYDNGAAASLQSKSDHILVISVFINTYDWVEMLRVDAHDPEYIPIIGKNMPWKEYVEADLPYRGTILDRRAEDIRYAIQRAADRDDVKIVIPYKYEELVEPYSNFDNYVKTEEFLGGTASSLPGIVGLLDEIQARTGLRPDESAGWRVPNKTSNQFWADPVGCSGELCFPSINKMRHDAEYIKYINDHIDWSTEVLIGYHKKSVPKAQVEQIVVLGERHSGAEWLTNRLQRCFPKTTVSVLFFYLLL